jgi:hypothetical protein
MKTSLRADKSARSCRPWRCISRRTLLMAIPSLLFEYCKDSSAQWAVERWNRTVHHRNVVIRASAAPGVEYDSLGKIWAAGRRRITRDTRRVGEAHNILSRRRKAWVASDPGHRLPNWMRCRARNVGVMKLGSYVRYQLAGVGVDASNAGRVVMSVHLHRTADRPAWQEDRYAQASVSSDRSFAFPAARSENRLYRSCLITVVRQLGSQLRRHAG